MVSPIKQKLTRSWRWNNREKTVRRVVIPGASSSLATFFFISLSMAVTMAFTWEVQHSQGCYSFSWKLPETPMTSGFDGKQYLKPSVVDGCQCPSNTWQKGAARNCRIQQKWSSAKSTNRIKIHDALVISVVWSQPPGCFSCHSYWADGPFFSSCKAFKLY